MLFRYVPLPVNYFEPFCSTLMLYRSHSHVVVMQYHLVVCCALFHGWLSRPPRFPACVRLRLLLSEFHKSMYGLVHLLHARPIALALPSQQSLQRGIRELRIVRLDVSIHPLAEAEIALKYKEEQGGIGIVRLSRSCRQEGLENGETVHERSVPRKLDGLVHRIKPALDNCCKVAQRHRGVVQHIWRSDPQTRQCVEARSHSDQQPLIAT